MKIAFSSILETIEQAKLKFDFSTSLQSPPDEIRDIQVYKSNSAGVKGWSFPPDDKMEWDNPLSAIIKPSLNNEFNFVFKNGQTSDAPMSDTANK